MAVTVLIPTVLRQHAGDQSAVSVEGKTVGEALKNLVAKYPGLKSHLFADNGKIRSFVNVFVNEDEIRQKGDMKAPLKNADEVSIVPSIAGGNIGRVSASGAPSAGVSDAGRAFRW